MNQIKVFTSPYVLAEKFAGELGRRITGSAEIRKQFTVALSGGSTPDLLYSILNEQFAKTTPWEYVQFFWGDERCVPPESDDSNFGMAGRKLLSKIEIPSSNIHRIRGEEDPGSEAIRYSSEIIENTRSREGLPVFDLVILGLGDDGHTASIFPGNIELLASERICEATFHPVTNQKRITLTGRVINNAESVVFLVTGNKKARVVKSIINKKPKAAKLPASFINPVFGSLEWYLDEEAASLL